MRSVLRAAIAALFLSAPAMAQDAALLERGRYLVEVTAACGNCHTPKGPQGNLPGRELAGGFVIDAPPFRAVTSNITQDPETGVGRWTDAQIARAIREGIRPDGSLIGPPMPFEFYRNLSDRDLQAMVAYLRTVPPIRNAVEKSTYRIPLPPAYGPPVTSIAPPADNPVARGAYLAGPVAHCLECHTPMGANGHLEMARLGAGGQQFPGPGGVAIARNLTPTGLGQWSNAEIERAIRAGVSRDGTRLQPPMAFYAYANMSPQDMSDLIAYLRTLPPH